MLTNVFNVLGNQSFLRDQGILSLESVQVLYEKTEQEPVPATIKISSLLDFCGESGYHETSYQPVIGLDGHAVVLHSYFRGTDHLVLLTFDSASETGYTFVFCSIVTKSGHQRLLISQYLNLLCLASEKCYYIHFNWNRIKYTETGHYSRVPI